MAAGRVYFYWSIRLYTFVCKSRARKYNLIVFVRYFGRTHDFVRSCVFYREAIGGVGTCTYSKSRFEILNRGFPLNILNRITWMLDELIHWIASDTYHLTKVKIPLSQFLLIFFPLTLRYSIPVQCEWPLYIFLSYFEAVTNSTDFKVLIHQCYPVTNNKLNYMLRISQW